MAEENRSKKATILENEEWFVQKSSFADEVTLQFDDDTELYVSAGFLMYASPVFKAMFTSNFEEKKTKRVKLEGKRVNDMLTFLKSIHPGILLNITTSNVEKIAPLAEEYQVDKIIAKCKEVMTIWLRRGYNFQEKDLLVTVPYRHKRILQYKQLSQSNIMTSQFGYHIFPDSEEPDSPEDPEFPSYTNRILKDVNICHKVLRLALQLNYTDIETEAVSILSKIPYMYTSGECEALSEDAAMTSKIKRMFEELSQNIKLKLCQKRLRDFDK